MSIILPNLNHSFVPVPVPVPFPDSGSVSGFRIPDFLVFHTPQTNWSAAKKNINMVDSKFVSM